MKESFIKKSNKIHNNKYDYSLVEYKDSHKKVKIICPIHGIFEQRPSNHIGGKQGCPQCGGTKKLTTNIFISKSNKIHNNKFDYSLVEYKNSHKKVKIICPIHGIFEQEAGVHLNGSDCPKCSVHNNRKIDDFLKKSKLKHNNKYDYSLVDYKNGREKVKIICPIHGVFEQKPHLHLKRGCPICEGNMKLTTEQIIFIFKEVHGNRYDYSLVNYKGDKLKVKIICPTHGIFQQQPANHKIGNGCPKCRESKGEKQIRKILDELNIKFVSQKKFPNCKDQKSLVFDFYLPDLNICVEYDGEQHFESNTFFGGDKRLIDQKRKDEIKNEYCENNNIKLLRIKFDDNIKNKINEFLIG